MRNEQDEDENEIDACITWCNPPDEELVELVEEGIEETLELFEDHPEMFSTEGDCVAHLYRNLVNKEYEERKLGEPHPNTGACRIRREWKRENSDKPIDIVIIDSANFEIEKEENTKTGGGFGTAPGQIAIEVKGPQIIKKEITDDIEKISKLMGNMNSNYHVVSKGYIVVFAGQELVNPPLEGLKREAESYDIKFCYEKTDRYQNL